MTVMVGYIVGALVVAAFGLLALKGEDIQWWMRERRLRKHTCHTTCSESRWCACGCRDGMGGRDTGTRCRVCGTQYVGVIGAGDEKSEGYSGPWSSGDHVEFRPSLSEITQENPAPRGFTSWGWERDREFRRARWTEGDEDGQSVRE